MAKQEQREIALNFITNAEETKSKVDALLNSLDKTDDSYAELEQQSASLESAIIDVNNAMNNNTGSSNILQNSIKKLEGETNKATTSLSKTSNTLKQNTNATNTQKRSTEDLTKSIVSNGGAISVLDSLTGGLASQVKNISEATGVFTTATDGSSKSLGGWKMALASTGIGLLIVGVTALINLMITLRQRTDEQVAAQLRLNEAQRQANFQNALSIKGYEDEIRLKRDILNGLSEEEAAQRRVNNLANERNLIREQHIAYDMEINDLIKKIGITKDNNLTLSEKENLIEKRLGDSKYAHYQELVKQRDAYKDKADVLTRSIDIQELDLKIEQKRAKETVKANEVRLKSTVKTNKKIVESEEERIARLKELAEEEEKIIEKIRILINEAFGNSSTKLLSNNEKKIKDYYKSWADEANKLYQILDAGVIDIEGFDKSIEDLDKAYEKLIANTENSNKSLAEAIAEANTELELFEKGQYLDTEGEALSIYELNESIIAISKTIDDVNSKKAFEDTFNVKDLVEANKEIDELWNTWMDFDEQLKNTLSEEDDLGSHKGLIRQNTRYQKAALETQAEDQIQRLQDLKLITKEEADILRELSDARMDLIDQMSEAELEAHNKERELKTKKLLDNEFALQLQKYFANKSIEIQEEQTRKLEELEERRLDKKRANQEAEEAIVNAAANSQAAHLDMVLSFMKEEDAERAKSTDGYKTLAIATATMDTYAAAISGYRSAMAMFSANPIVGNIVGIASIATAISTGIAQINAIRKVKVPGGGSGGGGSISASAGATPNVSFVSSSENQIANSVNANTNAQSQEPIKAYVVTKEISTGQELERNAIDNNSI